MIGRDAEVGGVAIDHAENRCDNAADGADLAPLFIDGGGHRVVVAKKLVGAVDEMHVHRR